MALSQFHALRGSGIHQVDLLHAARLHGFLQTLGKRGAVARKFNFHLSPPSVKLEKFNFGEEALDALA